MLEIIRGHAPAPCRAALGLAAVLLAGCALGGGNAPARGGLLTVAELRARHGVDTVATAPRAGPVAPIPREDAGAPAPAVPRPAGRPARESVEQGRWIHVTRRQPVIPLSLDDEPIAEVIAALAEETGFNIVLASDSVVRRTLLTAEIRDLPWHVALEAVLEAHSLRAIQLPSGVIKIVTATQAGSDRRMEPIDLRFLTARDMEPALSRLLAAGGDSAAAVEFVGDPATSRRLVVNGSDEEIAQVRSLVARLDRRPANVTVETRIVAVNRDRMRKTGISYSFGRLRADSATGGVTPTVEVRDRGTLGGGIRSENGPALQLRQRLGGLGRIDLDVFVDAMIGSGFAETQTTPMITTLSDVPAYIRVGDAFVLPNNQPLLGGALYPAYGGTPPAGSAAGGQGAEGGTAPGGYGDGQGGLQPPGVQAGYGASAGGFTRFETGTSLKVTPYLLGDGLVRVKIELQRDGGALSPDGRSISGGNQVAFSDVIVPAGSPIPIAGLTVSARSDASSGVPLLADLPLLGALFRVDERAEKYSDLLIIVTPRIEAPDAYVPMGGRD